MIQVSTIEQLNFAVRKLTAASARGLGTMELLRIMGIDLLTGLRGADWRGTDFAGCDLRGVDFSEARLSFCDFTDADVTGAIFFGADFFMSTLNRAKNLERAYLTNSQWKYVEDCNSFDKGSDTAEARVFRLNGSIRESASFQAAKLVFESILSKGLAPDQYSAGLLIERARKPDEAWEAYRIAENANCPMNSVIFTLLAARMRSAGEVREVMSEMWSLGIAPGIHVYNTLLSRVTSDDERERVLSEMEDDGIVPDNVTYQVLMRRRGLLGRAALFRRLVEAGLRPGVAELNILFDAADTREDVDTIFGFAREFDIGLDVTSYAQLAAFRTNRREFYELSEDMRDDDVSRDVDFYRVALKKARDLHAACFLYGRMKSDGISPDRAIYARFCRLVGTTVMAVGAEGAALEREIETVIRTWGTTDDLSAAGLT